MNELSELLVCSTTDAVSAQPMKLTEQLIDSAAVQNELERRQLVLQQLNDNLQTLKQLTNKPEETESIKGYFVVFNLKNDDEQFNIQRNFYRSTVEINQKSGDLIELSIDFPFEHSENDTHQFNRSA